MKATHWTATQDPEQWSDDPCRDPLVAAERAMTDQDDDDAWDRRHALILYKRAFVTVYGFIETNEPLSGDAQFDGYEPGADYVKPTGETLMVVVTLNYSLKENACPAS
jgi:hypothetical protein